MNNYLLEIDGTHLVIRTNAEEDSFKNAINLVKGVKDFNDQMVIDVLVTLGYDVEVMAIDSEFDFNSINDKGKRTNPAFLEHKLSIVFNALVDNNKKYAGNRNKLLVETYRQLVDSGFPHNEAYENLEQVMTMVNEGALKLDYNGVNW
jgi:hypothetical protein